MMQHEKLYNLQRTNYKKNEIRKKLNPFSGVPTLTETIIAIAPSNENNNPYTMLFLYPQFETMSRRLSAPNTNNANAPI